MSRLSLCFYDDSSWDYDVATPYVRPFGGSHSAMCYLAVELAKRGHGVTLLNNRKGAAETMGVRCIGRGDHKPADIMRAEGFDTVIVLNGPAHLSAWRLDLPTHTALVLWTQSDIDQAAMLELARRNTRRRWDRIVGVSDWHVERMAQGLGVERERMQVLRNAIGPRFEAMFGAADALAAAKTQPHLVYTSTPFRGLDLLLDAMPAIRERHRDAVAAIYSSLQVYNVGAADDPFAELYARARSTAGVDYRGGAPQPELAAALRAAAVLAYPNTFPETSCIAVMEALASGAFVVTSALGALPETTMGFGALIGDPPPAGARDVYLGRFAAAVNEAFDRWRDDRAAFAVARMEQVRAVNESCVWRVRAGEWEQALRAWRSA